MRITVGDPPIAGAEVFLDRNLIGLTGADGSLTVAEVAAGSHTIRAHKDGYEDDSATISVPETTSVTLTLTPIAKIRTEVRISSDKTTYTVGETARLTQGLYDEAGNLISGRTVDYTVALDGVWYAGWGQYSDDPSRDLILSKVGTYTITGEFAGDETYEPSSKSITITATRKETRADVWVRDFLPNKTARVCVLLEALVDGAWQPLPGKVVDVVVSDSAGAWYAGWGENTGTSWVCRGMGVEKSPLSFVVSFAGDDEYLPCSYTRTYEVPSIGCAYLLVEKGEWKPVTDPQGTYDKGVIYEAQGLCVMDFPPPEAPPPPPPPPPKISTRADVWVRDLIPNQTARVCVLLEELVDGTWQPLPEKTVDVAVYDPDGAWYAGWGETTGTSWVCRGFIADRSGTWTFVVSFAGDDEYLPCSYTRKVTAVAPEKIGTSIKISSDKTSYVVGESTYLTLGLYDEAGRLIDHTRVVDYTVLLDGTWYAGWGQYGDDTSRGITFSKPGTYTITGNFPGDDTYKPSSKSITVTATVPEKRCSDLLVERGEWKPVTDPEGTRAKGEYYESQGLCYMDF